MKKNLKQTIALCMSLLLCLGVFGSLAGVKDELPRLSAPGTSVSQSDAEVFGDKNVGEMSVDGETSRKDLCLMAEILCGEQISKETEKMSDEQLRQFVEEKLEAAENNGGKGGKDNSVASPALPSSASSDSSVTPSSAASENGDSSASSDTAAKPLGLDTDIDEDGEEAEEPSVNPEEHKDDYTEDGELKRPFDEVYPELMDTEVVEYDDETVLVKMDADFDGKVTAEMKKAGVAALEQLFPTEDAVWYEAFLVKGTEVDKAVESLRENKDILLVDYNYEVKTAAMDDYEEVDKKLHGNKNITEQWYMNYCGIPKGQKELANPGGSPSVVVAVIDTGVDYTHEDLSDNIWVNSDEIPGNGRDDDGNGYVDDYYGVNLVAGKGNADDDNGHGTHVAGIIAAENNNLGTVGIAYNTKIMPIKAAMASGILNQATIAKAIYYAYENGAEVINMSFGGPTCSIAVQDALAVAYTRCVLVASAGNDSCYNEAFFPILPNYPASLSYVLGVMSVGRKGVESGFTNMDGIAYTNHEYELYAPGEEILSTIPGDRYAKWSGTSMAAPVVSAFAALLRSEYADRDTYPTKFIYGQLSATSENQAICPHGGHNVPYITNLYSAVTKMPKPDVGLSDYYVFDSKGFEADETQVNNGDGVIDSGETVALGFVLRNRWGMSKNTVVTVDSLSQAGIPDPYIEYINPSVDYGSIGTYSTGDCGKIYDDELFSAWENPFYIRISEDCPNDYIFRVNIHIRCENALDEDDNTVYSGNYSVLLKVRSGCILPSVIKEDMTLTPENLYIIPNATTILEGVTVKVEPGTHIQFWSDDANDPYADNYIAYLRVEGQFLVEGTAENPVYLYPSELMSNYNVNIGQVNNGYVSLKYADLTNYMCDREYSYLFYNRISLAENCTFRKNTPDSVGYRYVSGGTVRSSSCSRIGTIGKAENCMFYKISENTYNSADIYGSFNRCAFVDCGLNYSDSSSNRFTNCVFYGNYFQSNTSSSYAKSSYTATSFKGWFSPSDVQIVYRPETGTSYALINEKSSGYYSAYKEYYDSLGWSYAVLETEDELQWLQKAGLNSTRVYVGAKRKNGKTVWSDGTPVGDFIDTSIGYTSSIDISDSNFSNYSTYYSLLEIPDEIYVSDIAFDEYHVRIDTGSTYRIRPITQPVPFEAKDLIFESADESIATVDETGLVTPVKKGRTDIYVSSKDRAVKNYVTVNVVDYVPLEDLSFEKDFCLLEVGESLALSCVLSPENTTRRNVTFSSSSPETVSVSESGVITANARGEAVITAACEGLTAEIRVQGVKTAEKLEITEQGKAYFLNQGRGALPEVDFGDADVKLSWKSSDNSVAQITDGELLLKSSGRVVLRVTDKISGLYADITVYVTEDEALPGITKIVYGSDYRRYILREDGTFYRFNDNKVLLEGVKDFDAGYECYDQYATCYCFLLEDGTIRYGSNPENLSTIDTLSDITRVYAIYGRTYFALSRDGICYAWGSNSNNCSGTGKTGTLSEPTMVNLENVTDMATYYHNYNYNYMSYFLTEDGKLYLAGNSDSYANPQLIKENVRKLTGYDYNRAYALVEDQWYSLNYNGISSSSDYPYTGNDCPGYVIENGRAYSVNSSGKKTLLSSKITNAKSIFKNGYATYIRTEDNLVYGYGINSCGALLGATNASSVSSENAVLLPTFGYDRYTLGVENVNVTDGILEDNELKIDFNGALKNYGGALYADGKQIPCTTSYAFDTITVSLSKGFSRGVSYRLVISPSNVSCWYLSNMAEEYTLDFTFGEPVPDEPEEETTEPVTGETEEETTEPVTEETSQEVTEPVTEEAAEETTEAVTEEETTEPESQEEPEEAEDMHEAVTDESAGRHYLTVDEAVETMNDAISSYNPYFYNNVILNRLSTEFDVNRWLRVLAPTSSSYSEVSFGRNYWGTTNEKAIALQTIDYTDFQTYAKLNCEPFLTEAPEDTFPFVTDVAIFDSNGTRVTTVGNEKITVRVSFNRDMDESIPLLVRFGSAYPYGDYEISGEYVDARTWEGTTTLSTIIENGNQYFTISDGKAKGTDLALMTDRYRFTFVIDTTAAQALIMQGNAADEGIELSWYQDDFDTLIGYNVYRSTSEDGYYQRLNSVVIPADTKTYFDDTVEPGVKYYYNFTVVKSDLTESAPSGKIVIMSKDTMAPNIYHTPVYTACMGSNLLINATVTDNLAVNTVKVYYRTVGTDEWKISFMNKLNDKYSALISAEDLSLDGFEYYIEAFDGVSSTYKGSAENPYRVTVQQPLDADSLGDVNGDGKITNLDALMLLQAINDLINLDSEQFARADLNADGVLTAAEALRILQYVSGAVGTVKM